MCSPLVNPGDGLQGSTWMDATKKDLAPLFLLSPPLFSPLLSLPSSFLHPPLVPASRTAVEMAIGGTRPSIYVYVRNAAGHRRATLMKECRIKVPINTP